MSYVGNVKKGGSTHLVGSTLYGTCATAAATAAKVVTCANFDALLNGVTIHVLMSYANTADSPTLNVNGTGAKGVRFISGAARGFWGAGEVVSFTYNGTYWLMNDAVTPVTRVAGTWSGTLASGTETVLSKNIITLPLGGVYIGTARLQFSANASGIRRFQAYTYNSSGTQVSVVSSYVGPPASTGTTVGTIPVAGWLNQDLTLGISAQQTSGSTLSLEASIVVQCFRHAVSI